MNLTAVATVFAPGLVPPPADDSDDPMAALAWMDKGLRLTTALARAHVTSRLRASPPDLDDDASAGNGVLTDAPAVDDEDCASPPAGSRRPRLSIEDRQKGYEALMAEMHLSVGAADAAAAGTPRRAWGVGCERAHSTRTRGPAGADGVGAVPLPSGLACSRSTGRSALCPGAAWRAACSPRRRSLWAGCVRGRAVLLPP